jgi:hypothetical protein
VPRVQLSIPAYTAHELADYKDRVIAMLSYLSLPHSHLVNISNSGEVLVWVSQDVQLRLQR